MSRVMALLAAGIMLASAGGATVCTGTASQAVNQTAACLDNESNIVASEHGNGTSSCRTASVQGNDVAKAEMPVVSVPQTVPGTKNGIPAAMPVFRQSAALELAAGSAHDLQGTSRSGTAGTDLFRGFKARSGGTTGTGGTTYPGGTTGTGTTTEPDGSMRPDATHAPPAYQTVPPAECTAPVLLTPPPQRPVEPTPTPTPTSTPSATPMPSPSPTVEPSESPEPTSTPSVEPGPMTLDPDASDVPADVEIIQGPDGPALTGVHIGTLWVETPADLIASWILRVGDDSIRIVTDEHEQIAPEDQVATGMTIEAVSPDDMVTQEAVIVVMGDVVGSGEINLTQLARLSSAYSGQNPLTGPYAMAGDLDGSGQINLTDVVQIVDIYQEGTLSVACVVTDANQSEVLEEAGFDLEPWTSDLAVLSPNIPEYAEIERVAWTQHDIFSGGREQELYYEGDEEDLIFGAYAEGRTIVTTTVTTAAGKTGTRETEVIWQSETVDEPGSLRRLGVSEVRTADDTTSARTALDSMQQDTAQPEARAAARASSTAAPKPTSTASAPSPADLLATYRREVLTGTNDLRNANKVQPPLARSTNLAKAAMVRAQEMANAGELSHTRPDGTKFRTVVELGHGAVVGENIHCNKGYPTPQIAQVAVRGWANSAPHRKQILQKRYAYTGIGFVQADDGMWYCVQMFSNSDKVLSVDTPKA